MARFDRVRPVRCPLCRAVLLRRGTVSSRRTPRTQRRAALLQHLLQAHPELGTRDRMVLLDRAVRS